MGRERVAVSWSGGKDSAMTLHALRADERVEVTALLTTVTAGHERVSMHGVRTILLERQAKAVGLPVLQARLSPASSNAEYDEAMAGAVALLAHRGVRRVAFGDLFLADVRAYREERLAGTGLDAAFPVWQRDPAAFVREFLALGFRAVVVCVDTEALDPSFAGRELDASLLADLPVGVDPCGERGEFHTFVYDGPEFGAPVGFSLGRPVLRDGRFCFRDLLPA